MGAAQAMTIVADGGFEGGTPNADWSEASTYFSTPLCTVPTCGSGGGSGPRSGTWWAWFGGVAADEVGSMSQSVQLDVGALLLSFWFELPVADSAADYLQVRIDGAPIWTYHAFDGPLGAEGYEEVTLDLTAWGDGAAHLLTFASEVFGLNGGVSNFFVDDVSIAFTPTGDVPVPAPLALMAGGLVATGGLLRRAKARRRAG